jgi:quercetin dioxygenase-like cupin family protein
MEDAMRSVTRQLALIVLIGAFFVAWRARTDRDVAVAQAARKPIMITRIFTSPDGQTHAEEVELKMTTRGTSEIKATSAEFSSRPAGPPNDNWHTGPARQFVITLSGRAELQVSDGKKVITGPGHINLIEDTTGKGHITRNLEDRIVVTIPLADQSAEIGK